MNQNINCFCGFVFALHSKASVCMIIVWFWNRPMADNISTIYGLGEDWLVVFICLGQFGLFLSYYNTQKGILVQL